MNDDEFKLLSQKLIDVMVDCKNAICHRLDTLINLETERDAADKQRREVEDGYRLADRMTGHRRR